MRSRLKKDFKVCCLLLVVVFALIGFYNTLIFLQHRSIKGFVESREAERDYEPELLYNMNGGEPLFLVNPEYEQSFIFFEGFRALAPAGMYEDWFREIHQKQEINILVPVYGLQSFPFAQRDRGSEWHYQEDMRTGIQIYDAYTALLPENHRIVTGSMSFGTLLNLAVCAKAERKPDAVILMSPLNSGLDFRAAGEIVHWLSKQTSWLRHIIPYSRAGTPPGRATPWDIVNDQINVEVAETFYMNYEDSSQYGYQTEIIAGWLEERLVPLTKDLEITIIWGDSDLYFSQEGFNNLASLLSEAGNNVSLNVMHNSGHMVLLDNDRNRAREIVLEVFTQ